MRPWVAPTLVVALLVLGSAWFLTTFERVPQKEWVGPSGEARRDPFLAARRFAVRMGMVSQAVRALPELDRLSARGVLLLPAGRQAIDPRRLGRIVRWVEDGGHLIAEAELPGVSDPLFDRLGVLRRSGGRDFSAPLVETANGRKLKASLSGRTLLRLPAEGETLFSVGAPESTLLASFGRGRGTATLAGSLDFARNTLIGEDDNAEFFGYLLNLTPARELHVFLRQERLSLLRFLGLHAWPVLIATVGLLVLWLWRIGPRFGPVRPDAPPARRRLLDHLRASGRYYWAHGMRMRLVSAAREAALRHLTRTHPDFAAASTDERAAHLASLIAVSKEEAKRFLHAADAASTADFMALVLTAQKIHSALDRGTR